MRQVLLDSKQHTAHSTHPALALSAQLFDLFLLLLLLFLRGKGAAALLADESSQVQFEAHPSRGWLGLLLVVSGSGLCAR